MGWVVVMLLVVLERIRREKKRLKIKRKKYENGKNEKNEKNEKEKNECKKSGDEVLISKTKSQLAREVRKEPPLVPVK